MKTYNLKPKDVIRKWYLLDASKLPLGRVATQAARLLIGKGKANTSPHIDNGDYVVIINSSSLVATGNKSKGKVYYRHSGYPGGIRQRTLSELSAHKPEEAIHHAIRGMLPDNKLREGRLKRLKIYADSAHNHEAQKPEEHILEGKDK